ncbi:hypothetical protein [Streptomyces sp. UG1]|uniref:hypothetical protein n=1 Tax=Streptomyces sp. UG1 TaxID=3417652 RepID=UPI003CED40DC
MAEWQSRTASASRARRCSRTPATADSPPAVPLGQAFLHRSRVPLDQAPIDHVTAAEWVARQRELDDPAAAAEELEDGVVDGCSPWACRGETEPVQDDFGLAS